MKKKRRREKSRNRGEERKQNPSWKTQERMTSWKRLKRGKETKGQAKGRRRNHGKDYKRQRNLNPKIYPNQGVQRRYQRPSYQRKAYQLPKKRGKNG